MRERVGVGVGCRDLGTRVGELQEPLNIGIWVYLVRPTAIALLSP